MSGLAALWNMLRDAVRALTPSGDGPILILVISVTTLVALSVGAPKSETLLVDFLGLCAFFLWSERKHLWRRRDDEAAYDALERQDAAAVRRRLEKKATRNGKEGRRTDAPAEDGPDA